MKNAWKRFVGVLAEFVDSLYWYLFWVAYGLGFSAWHGTRYQAYEELNALAAWWLLATIYFGISLLWAWLGLKHQNSRGWMRGWNDHADVIARVRKIESLYNYRENDSRTS